MDIQGIVDRIRAWREADSDGYDAATDLLCAIEEELTAELAARTTPAFSTAVQVVCSSCRQPALYRQAFELHSLLMPDQPLVAFVCANCREMLRPTPAAQMCR